MRELLARYITENLADLLALDIKIARVLGVPAPHTLSSYAYVKHGVWERIINSIFRYLFNEKDHCHNDFIRVTRKADNA